MKECIVTKEALDTAKRLINFPDDQWNAILLAAEKVSESAELRALLAQNVESTDSIPVDEMRAKYGEWAGMYPMLPLIMRLPRMEEIYKERGIDETVLRDTLGDFTLWVTNSLNRTGRMELREYSWLCGYTSINLFRLGRLEFAFGSYENEPAIEVHIPEGEPMTDEEVEKSLSRAPAFFAKHFPEYPKPKQFVCESWLLSPAWPQILPESSNVRRFMERFRIDRVLDDWQTFERVFNNCRDLDKLPTDTSMRRAIIAWYRAGNTCPAAEGVIPIP